MQSPDLWEIKVGNAPLLQNQRLLALRNRQPRFPLREEPSVTMEGEWPPLPPQAGWGGGWLAVFANICTWLGCTCQARTDLEAAGCTCSSDSPHSICGGDGPAESCASLHPSFPPACGLAEGWGGRGGASSSSISAPSLCDLGPVLT